MHEWINRNALHVRTRADALLREVDFDPAEVIMVAALWINLLHRLFWQSRHRTPGAYTAMSLVLGEELLTIVLIVLAVMGLMAFMLYLPKLRRNINLSIATYFVTNGSVMLFVTHDSLLGCLEIFVFGIAGFWTHWRQGKGTGQYDRRGYP